MKEFTTAGNVPKLDITEESIKDAMNEVKKARELYIQGLAKVASFHGFNIIANPMIHDDQIYMMTSEAFAEEINKAIKSGLTSDDR